jgi:hypothetical protein
VTTDVSHRCMAQARCRARVQGDDGKKVAAATEKPDTLCEHCTRACRYACEELPRHYVALRLAIGDKLTGNGQFVRSTPTPQTPIDIHKAALVTTIVESLASAADVVSNALHCDPPQGSEAHRVDACSRMVTPNMDKLIAAPAEDTWVWARDGERRRLMVKTGVTLALELRELPALVASALGETTKKLWIDERCPDCGFGRLYQEADSGPGVVNPLVCPKCRTAIPSLPLFGKILEQERQEEEKLANEKLEAELAAANATLAQVRKLAELPPEELETFDTDTIIKFLKLAVGA